MSGRRIDSRRSRATAKLYGLGKMTTIARLADALTRRQEQSERDTDKARGNVTNESRSIRNVTIPSSASTPNTVRILHRLGRVPNGYTIQRVRSGGPPEFTESSVDARAITLEGTKTGTTVVDILVY